MVLFPLILDERFLMDLLAIGTSLMASHYAEILLKANMDEFMDEFIRCSKYLINDIPRVQWKEVMMYFYLYAFWQDSVIIHK